MVAAVEKLGAGSRVRLDGGGAGSRGRWDRRGGEVVKAAFARLPDAVK